MKYLSLILALLLLTSLVQAEENSITSNISEASKAISSGTAEISLPPALQSTVKAIFNLDADPNLQLIIILIALFFFVFVVLWSVAELIPIVGDKFPKASAILITIIIAASGGLRDGAIFFSSLGSNFAFLANWSAGAISLVIIVLFAIAFIFKKVSTKLKEYQEIQKAHHDGMESGINEAYVKEKRKTSDFFNN